MLDNFLEVIQLSIRKVGGFRKSMIYKKWEIIVYLYRNKNDFRVPKWVEFCQLVMGIV